MTFLLAIIVLVIGLYFFGQVLKKAGYSPWLALLGLIPLVNIVMLWIFAFGTWPNFPKKG